uniref:Uncharacterized protein n=2 Tax=Chrysotila carterae TaxID=13221 RepID=A0A7S4B9Z4_CHRCT|mmetsp:Transcript_27379/g.57618  ORF Transcript_27379/g.57618 Transcript_27379/m.57618 type:complete len:484 (-) Transcript_27379:1689-3140(-)
MLHGCIILSASGKTLLYSVVGAYALQPRLRPESLTSLLTTIQDFTGGPDSAFVQIESVGVSLQQQGSLIVAVLCEPSEETQSCARLTALQLLHTFSAQFSSRAKEIDEEHRRHISSAASSYTFQSATQDQHTAAIRTLDVFLSFERQVVQPLLLRPRLGTSCLAPLDACSTALRSMLIDEAGDGKACSVIYPGLAKSGHPLGIFAGAHTPSVWSAVSTAAATLCQRLVRASYSGEGVPEQSAVMAFPSLADAASNCLHVLVHAVHIGSGAGCVVLFYSAVTPPLSKVETTGPDTMPLATEPALARKASVKDERQPQPSPLTRLLSLLGRAWGSSRQSCAISDASSVSEKQRSQQHVSQGHFSSKVVRLPSAAVPQDLYAATKQVVVSLNSAFIAAVDAASQQQDKLSSLFHPTVMKQDDTPVDLEITTPRSGNEFPNAALPTHESTRRSLNSSLTGSRKRVSLEPIGESALPPEETAYRLVEH